MSSTAVDLPVSLMPGDSCDDCAHRLSDALHGAIGLQLHAREFTAEGEEAFVPDADGESWGVFLVEDLHEDLEGRA